MSATYRCSFLNPRARDNPRKRLLRYIEKHRLELTPYVSAPVMAAHLLGTSERTIRRILKGERVSCETCTKLMGQMGRSK